MLILQKSNHNIKICFDNMYSKKKIELNKFIYMTTVETNKILLFITFLLLIYNYILSSSSFYISSPQALDSFSAYNNFKNDKY